MSASMSSITVMTTSDNTPIFQRIRLTPDFNEEQRTHGDGSPDAKGSALPNSHAVAEGVGPLAPQRQTAANSSFPSGPIQQAGVTQQHLASALESLLGSAGAAQGVSPSLAEILQAKNLVPLLQDPAVQRRLGELVEFLPEEHQAEAHCNVSLVAVLYSLHRS